MAAFILVLAGYGISGAIAVPRVAHDQAMAAVKEETKNVLEIEVDWLANTKSEMGKMKADAAASLQSTQEAAVQANGLLDALNSRDISVSEIRCTKLELVKKVDGLDKPMVLAELREYSSRGADPLSGRGGLFVYQNIGSDQHRGLTMVAGGNGGSIQWFNAAGNKTGVMEIESKSQDAVSVRDVNVAGGEVRCEDFYLVDAENKLLAEIFQYGDNEGQADARGGGIRLRTASMSGEEWMVDLRASKLGGQLLLNDKDGRRLAH